MILINLDTLETSNKLVKVCDKYSKHMDIDVLYDRYILNGTSILAVTSLLGNTVEIKPVTNDDLLLTYFTRDIQEINAWIED